MGIIERKRVQTWSLKKMLHLLQQDYTSVVSGHTLWLFWGQQKKNVPTGERSIMFCCLNDGMFVCRSRAHQSTHVNTLNLKLTVCKLYPFLCICPNMLSYSDAACQEALPCSLGRPATSQAKCSSTPKMSRSVSLKATQFRGIHLHFHRVWADNCCTCWKSKGKNLLLYVKIVSLSFYWFLVGLNLLPSYPRCRNPNYSQPCFVNLIILRWSPAAFGMLSKLCQLTSVLLLAWGVSSQQRIKRYSLLLWDKLHFFLMSGQKNTNYNIKETGCKEWQQDFFGLPRLFNVPWCTTRPLMPGGYRSFLDVWVKQLT